MQTLDTEIPESHTEEFYRLFNVPLFNDLSIQFTESSSSQPTRSASQSTVSQSSQPPAPPFVSHPPSSATGSSPLLSALVPPTGSSASALASRTPSPLGSRAPSESASRLASQASASIPHPPPQTSSLDGYWAQYNNRNHASTVGRLSTRELQGNGPPIPYSLGTLFKKVYICSSVMTKN